MASERDDFLLAYSLAYSLAAMASSRAIIVASRAEARVDQL
jgi:hypothetical protein